MTGLRAVNPYLCVALVCVLSVWAPRVLAVDTDSDGIDNATDNCLLIVNANQRDTDADGYGNWCDADYNQDGTTNFLDLSLLRSVFADAEPFADPLAEHVDMNGDGVVNFLDLALYRDYFLQPPGPAASAEPFNANDAARFLAQATFGPKQSEIDALAASGDIEGWIDQQMIIPASNHEAVTRAAVPPMCFGLSLNLGMDGFFVVPREVAWWQIVIENDDQLRQRVAFALSQILVVGDSSDLIAGSQYGMASYYDMLASHAFGNYRDLLEDVTLHPIMGIFLSMVRNQRPNPALNIRPDENYARELLQLFTIGVHELNLDGTKVLDGEGNPIATYDQTDIENLARVFTGWNFERIGWTEWFGFSDRTKPMEPWEVYHDTDEKTLLNGVVLPAGQDTQTDLDGALDNVFMHPNVGPFIGRQLIQRLVTSNPTPGYVERVASAFNDNGAGVRGDLGAVVRAILLDPEARLGHTYLPDSYGKLREPLLRLSHLRRSMSSIPRQLIGNFFTGVECGEPAYNVYYSQFGSMIQNLGQQALRSPSVFNFYQPDYSPPGLVREAGLVAPEFQLFVASIAQSTGKIIAFEAQNNGFWGPGSMELDMTIPIGLAADPNVLLDYYDTILMGGSMSIGMRDTLMQHMTDASLPADSSLNETRARDALMLIVMSPEYLIQR
ncbi:MAG: DUF1800 family protein [Pseudomonadota bacterium]